MRLMLVLLERRNAVRKLFAAITVASLSGAAIAQSNPGSSDIQGAMPAVDTQGSPDVGTGATGGVTDASNGSSNMDLLRKGASRHSKKNHSKSSNAATTGTGDVNK
jgi:hypothetical protein